MIGHFRVIGKGILSRKGFYQTQSPVEQRKMFLDFHTLLPIKKKESIDRAIALNFDTHTRQCFFTLDKELLERKSERDGMEEYRDYFFAFKVGAPRDTKKFLATNNVESLLSKTIAQSMDYLNENRRDKKLGPWFDRHISQEYDALLQHLLNSFYCQEGEDWVLNEQFLIPDQQQRFQQIKQDLMEKQKDPTKPLNREKIYVDLLTDLFKHEKNVNLPSLALIKINGKHIMETETLRDSYINMVYYDLFQRFFLEDGAGVKRCFTCQEEKEVIGKIPFPMKFYGTTNSLYFENVNNANAHKSFCICQDCLREVLVGMKFTDNYLNEYIFDLNCYMIPTLEEEDSQFEKKLKAAAKMLTGKELKYRDDIANIKTLLKNASKKNLDFTFNLMFYHTEQQSFDILKYIPDIHLRRLLKKMEKFAALSEQYELDQIGEYDNSLRLNDIRYYLFPSDKSHPKVEFKQYGKDLLNFLADFLNETGINYNELIRDFMDIYKRRYFRENIERLSPFKMVLFLTILKDINILKEGSSMSLDAHVTDIMKPEYQAFFDTHAAIYGQNIHRQGLFLLGTIISKIVYAQRDKSSTFLRKINFDGLPARRVKGLIGEVKEFADIYKVYAEPGIWGNIMDRLQGIETTPMKGDEIAFYILTGISYADYLGLKFAHSQKLLKTIKNNEHNQQEAGELS